MFNVKYAFAFTLGLSVTTGIRASHDNTHVQLAEIASACAIAPTSIAAQLARAGNDTVKFKTAAFANLARVVHSAIASYNHYDDQETNKYNLFGLGMSSLSLCYNLYKLSTTKQEESSTRHNKEISLSSLVHAVLFGFAEAGLGVHLATGGSMPLSKFAQKGGTYRIALSDTYGNFPALSSGLLSMLRCYNSMQEVSDSRAKLGIVGLLLGHVYFVGKDYKRWYHFDQELATQGFKPSDAAGIKKSLELSVAELDEKVKATSGAEKTSTENMKEFTKQFNDTVKPFREAEKALNDAAKNWDPVKKYFEASKVDHEQAKQSFTVPEEIAMAVDKKLACERVFDAAKKRLETSVDEVKKLNKTQAEQKATLAWKKDSLAWYAKQ